MAETKLHPMLRDLEKDLSVGFLEETFECRGRKWFMRLLCDHEENWASNYIQQGTVYAVGRSRRAPILGIGIRQVDGLPVSSLFQEEWDAQDEAVQQVVSQSRFSKQYWDAEHLFQFLSEQPPEFVEELWGYWQSLQKRRDAAQEELKKSSAETSEISDQKNGDSQQSTDSDPSSLPGSPESSQPQDQSRA